MSVRHLHARVVVFKYTGRKTHIAVGNHETLCGYPLEGPVTLAPRRNRTATCKLCHQVARSIARLT